MQETSSKNIRLKDNHENHWFEKKGMLRKACYGIMYKLLRYLFIKLGEAIIFSKHLCGR